MMFCELRFLYLDENIIVLNQLLLTEITIFARNGNNNYNQTMLSFIICSLYILLEWIKHLQLATTFCLFSTSKTNNISCRHLTYSGTHALSLFASGDFSNMYLTKMINGILNGVNNDLYNLKMIFNLINN